MAAPKQPGGNAGKGRPLGVPNKATAAVREVAQIYTVEAVAAVCAEARSFRGKVEGERDVFAGLDANCAPDPAGKAAVLHDGEVLVLRQAQRRQISTANRR